MKIVTTHFSFPKFLEKVSSAPSVFTVNPGMGVALFKLPLSVLISSVRNSAKLESAEKAGLV
jgi:hypothetical protein